MKKTSLRDLFYNHEGKEIHKWDHYLDIYERYFEKYRDTSLIVLEIGVSHGGSLQLWKNYFGKGVMVYGVDINPSCKSLEEEQCKIFIGSQEDDHFLQFLSKNIPDPDIIIDDGGHTMKQQIKTFNHLFPKLKSGGLYLVEDTHTSYWKSYGGGLKKKKSFIEYSKNKIDSLYEHHLLKDNKLEVNDLTKYINCITFFDSVVVFEKELRKKPFHLRKGKETLAPGNALKKRKILSFNKNEKTFELNKR